jgi:DNA-binding transcriptional regulator YdaS (Cro superfamily)
VTDDALPEEKLAMLLALLPPAPEGWAEAAKALPAARAQLDGLIARAERDAAYREDVLLDLEQALRAEGIEPNPALQRELARRLARPD